MAFSDSFMVDHFTHLISKYKCAITNTHTHDIVIYKHISNCAPTCTHSNY